MPSHKIAMWTIQCIVPWLSFSSTSKIDIHPKLKDTKMFSVVNMLSACSLTGKWESKGKRNSYSFFSSHSCEVKGRRSWGDNKIRNNVHLTG